MQGFYLFYVIIVDEKRIFIKVVIDSKFREVVIQNLDLGDMFSERMQKQI